jgi:hypothetical protein
MIAKAQILNVFHTACNAVYGTNFKIFNSTDINENENYEAINKSFDQLCDSVKYEGHIVATNGVEIPREVTHFENYDLMCKNKVNSYTEKVIIHKRNGINVEVANMSENTKQINGKTQRRYFIGGNEDTLVKATEIKTVGQMKTYLLGRIAELHAELLNINCKADFNTAGKCATAETVARTTIMGQLASLEKTLHSKCHVSNKSIKSFEHSVTMALVKKVDSKSKKSIEKSKTVITKNELKTILKDSTKEFEATQLKDVANALANVKGDKVKLEEFATEFKFTTQEAEKISSNFDEKLNIKSKKPLTPENALKAIVKDKECSFNPACAIAKPATPVNMLTSANDTPVSSPTPTPDSSLPMNPMSKKCSFNFAYTIAKPATPVNMLTSASDTPVSTPTPTPIQEKDSSLMNPMSKTLH